MSLCEPTQVQLKDTNLDYLCCLEGSLYILGVYNIIPVSMDIQIHLFKATTQAI